MKPIFLLFFSTFIFSQESSMENDSSLVDPEVAKIDSVASVQEPLANDSLKVADEATQPTNLEPIDEFDTSQSVPLSLESGYKGFPWGASARQEVITSYYPVINSDSLSADKIFSGRLGPDSVNITYSFADSGFWKVEIDFILSNSNFDKQISDFRRHEKNISSVYGPPKKINQKESGVSSAYSNVLEQKFSHAFYRSSWSFLPAVVELYLNTSVLHPYTDLKIFSSTTNILKLVYYNPDYMHSSEPSPSPELIPSIFDIY